MNEGAIEPLDVIVFGEGKEDLVTDDGEGQQEDGTSRHCQGEGAQVQTAKGNALSTVAQLIFILKINPIIVDLFIRPISAPVLQLQTCAVCICVGGNLTRLRGCDSPDWTQGTNHLLGGPHFTASLKDLIN